jgi:alpha-aminoadipic semialdehyde synthase
LLTADISSNKNVQFRSIVPVLPQTMHVQVAELCITLKKPLVTASYVSPQMMALNDKAKAAGVTILGEMGLDPGMDHMSAMKVIDEAKAKGSVVRSFSSICGGLPAPEAADNPLGYKFSWSPKGECMRMCLKN